MESEDRRRRTEADQDRPVVLLAAVVHFHTTDCMSRVAADTAAEHHMPAGVMVVRRIVVVVLTRVSFM